jgi:hypothetical protein
MGSSDGGAPSPERGHRLRRHLPHETAYWMSAPGVIRLRFINP